MGKIETKKLIAIMLPYVTMVLALNIAGGRAQNLLNQRRREDEEYEEDRHGHICCDIRTAADFADSDLL